MSDDERIEQLELENKVLQENNKGLKAKIDELQKENQELKEKYENINWYFENQKENFISKDKIRKFIKEELPDDEIMKCCEMFDSNGIYLRKKLEEILEENK